MSELAGEFQASNYHPVEKSLISASGQIVPQVNNHCFWIHFQNVRVKDPDYLESIGAGIGNDDVPLLADGVEGIRAPFGFEHRFVRRGRAW